MPKIIINDEFIEKYQQKYDEKDNDIDLGVKGIEPRLFFKFYAELLKHLTKPVHLIDLKHK